MSCIVQATQQPSPKLVRLRLIEESYKRMSDEIAELKVRVIYDPRQHRKPFIGLAEYDPSELFPYTVYLAPIYFKLIDESRKETLDHEIAHILSHSRHGTLDHDMAWRRVMNELGYERPKTKLIVLTK